MLWAGRSASLAAKVCTAVVFSAVVAAAAEVKMGALSLAGVTDTLMAWTLDKPLPSLTASCTS